MKKKMKLIALLMVAAILLAQVLVGCDSGVDTPPESSPEAALPSGEPTSDPGNETPEPTTPESTVGETDGGDEQPELDLNWSVGFASREIALPSSPKTPLYIAGYNQGVEIDDVHDLQRANAVWLDSGDDEGGMLIISIDCVGLAAKYVKEIRTRLADFAAESGCAAINVVSTHTHAGLDTFGLWGPAGVDGKNAEFMENLVAAAVEAGKAAYADRSEGTLNYGSVKTQNMLRDSRLPSVVDANLYQLRFDPEDDSQNGIRIVIYGAHAESMRGANTTLSRDYPGEMSNLVKSSTGDDMLYLPGPIGGLVMTLEFANPFNAIENLEITGRKLTDYLLSIKEEDEIAIPSSIDFVRESLEVPVENGVFKLYKQLGILDNEIYEANGEVIVKSELNLICLGGKDGVLFGLIPGEIFPELVSGTSLKKSDPTALSKLAKDAGYTRLLTVNLANDELGYIVPPSDFIVHPTNPYFQRYEVNGEDHYEETNSVGKLCAEKIAEAFASALEKLG